MLEGLLLCLLIALASVGGWLLWQRLHGPVRGWRAWGRAVALVLVLLPLCGWGTWRFSRSRTVQAFGTLVRRVETAEPVVALTFDDGPTPEGTTAVLAILAEEDVRATFFVTGRELEQYPEEGRRLVEAGHELGNHTYSHRSFVFVSWATVRDEIERTDRLIRQAGYTGPSHFRPPGTKKLFLLPLYLAQTGRLDVSYDVEAESDPAVAHSASGIAERTIAQARPGSIILLHVMYPSREATRQALPEIIRGLKRQHKRLWRSGWRVRCSLSADGGSCVSWGRGWAKDQPHMMRRGATMAICMDATSSERRLCRHMGLVCARGCGGFGV